MSSVASASSLRWRDGARAAVAAAATVWFFGASFGLVARASGVRVLAPFVTSATTFAGSAQFAAASFLGGSGAALAAMPAAVVLNARYTPTSVFVAPLFHGLRLRRLAEAQPRSSTSRGHSPGASGCFDRRVLLGTGW